jgi:Uma2 family endonuclease
VRIGKARAYTYPDILVICGKPHVADDQQDTVLNPTVIIEVLSPSAAMIDRVKTFDVYTSIPSLQEYLLVAQDSATIEQFVRQSDGKWLYSKVTGLETEIVLPSINVTLKLADVYEDVSLPAADASEEPQEGPI